MFWIINTKTFFFNAAPIQIGPDSFPIINEQLFIIVINSLKFDWCVKNIFFSFLNKSNIFLKVLTFEGSKLIKILLIDFFLKFFNQFNIINLVPIIRSCLESILMNIFFFDILFF